MCDFGVQIILPQRLLQAQQDVWSRQTILWQVYYTCYYYHFKEERTCRFTRSHTHYNVSVFAQHLSWRHPPPPIPPRAPPPSSPAPKRTGKSLGAPVSQSVVCVRRLLSVSLPTCVQPGCRQGARPSVGLIIRSEATPGLQSLVGLFVFSQNLWLFLFIFFPTSGLKKQSANMSRAPEDVSKLTESTYKVSDITKQGYE